MDSNLAISVREVTKIYRLYDKPIDRLKESLSLTKKKLHKDFFALDKLSFEVKKGETVGIIGTNGSGKSTILKINPVFYIVTGFRDSMLAGNWFWQRPTLTVYYWAVTILVLILGLRVFRKLRPHFSDVL